MSRNYDNWERLVAAVLKREEIWQLCHQPSRTPSICSTSSDFSSISRLSDVNKYIPKKEESLQRPFSKHVFQGPFSHGLLFKICWNILEWLGKGRFGDSYLTQLWQDARVSEHEVLAKGTQLVMKKLENVVNVTDEEFKKQIMVFINCRHENVGAPNAYYFSYNTKYVFYDYYSQGSVSCMLSRNRSSFNWESRLRVAIGAARGIAHIHAQCGGNLVHGNLKSSNVFLNSQNYGCVSDFSLAGMTIWPPQRGEWYLGPSYYNVVSQEMDVYDFGNLLLQLLTGDSAMEVKGFDIDLGLDMWIRSIEPQVWTSKLFDQSLKRTMTDTSGGHLSATRPVARLSDLYFPAKDLMEMMETLHVAERCLAVFPSNKQHRTKMSDVVLMLENISSSSDGKIQRALNYNQHEEKSRIWNRIFR